MSEEYVLELEHIRKEYPGVVALKDVTLQLKKGEILALIGENGAGKSTLIKCCSGAVIPTSGKIKVNGKEIELEKATSVEVYLESAGYQMKRIAVELNGEILPKNEYADRMLEDGDCMEVVTFVGGG